MTGEICRVHFEIYLPTGAPASFTQVTVYYVFRFLWWEFDWWVTTLTANVYGRVWLTLRRWLKYRFRFRHPMARELNLWRTLTICPHIETVRLPRK